MNRGILLCSPVFIIATTLFKNVSSNKYCAFELAGEAKYYVCPRNEYCCNFGCCVNPAFQFYQLWYYWLLVIFMFMVCSGTGWWYRYCRTSVSSPCLDPSGLAVASSSSRCENVRRARVTYRPGVDHSTLYLQRVWKGPPMPPPTYSRAPTQGCAEPVIENIAQCPYYQLYGPPPSYDSVVHLTENSLTTNVLMSSIQEQVNPPITIPTIHPQGQMMSSLPSIHPVASNHSIQSSPHLETFASDGASPGQSINATVPVTEAT